MAKSTLEQVARPIQKLIIGITSAFVGVGLAGAIFFAISGNFVLSVVLFSATGYVAVRLTAMAILTYKKGIANLGRPKSGRSVLLDTTNVRRELQREQILRELAEAERLRGRRAPDSGLPPASS